MKTPSILLTAIVLAGTAVDRASATPAVYYNPANGAVWFHNDTGSTVFAFGVESGSGDKFLGSYPNALEYARIPGSTFDAGDLPFAFTYLNFPTGTYCIGMVAVPNTPISDFSSYLYRSAQNPVRENPPVLNFQAAAGNGVILPPCPEPAGGVMACVALAALAARRKKKPRG